MAHCSEHSRAAFVRRGLAEAGRGLPAIEPGMPVPAGTGLDRRTFIARGVGLALAVYGGAALRPELFDEGIAAAAASTVVPMRSRCSRRPAIRSIVSCGPDWRCPTEGRRSLRTTH